MLSLHRRSRSEARDWCYSLSLFLDAQVPGFLGYVCRTGDQRHLVYATLSIAETLGLDELARRLRPLASDGAEDDRSVVANAIMQNRLGKVVAAAFEGVPGGFVGIIGRFDFEPLLPAAYLDLHELFALSDPRAKALRQLSGRIAKADILLNALALDHVLLTPASLSRSHSDDRVAGLNAAVALIRRVCLSATDEALRTSFSAHEGPPVEWVQKWLARFDRLPFKLPFEETASLRVPSTGAAIKEAGRRTSTCVADLVPDILLENRLYAVAQNDSAVVELRALRDRWFVTFITGAGNRPIEASVESRLVDELAAVGIVDVRHELMATPLTTLLGIDLKWPGLFDFGERNEFQGIM